MFKKTFLILVAALTLVVIVGGVYYLVFGGVYKAVRNIPYENESKEHLGMNANRDYQKRAKKIIEDPTLSIREKNARITALRIETDQTQHEISTGQSKSCPGEEKRAAEQFSMDISTCAVGQFTGMTLLNDHDEEVYSVRLFAYGKNDKGEKDPSIHVPVIAAAKMDILTKAKYNVAEPVGDLYQVEEGGKIVAMAQDFKLQGHVKIVPEGNADYVEFVRK